MDTNQAQYSLTEGTDVVGSDGDKVGEVVAVHANYVVVEKGFFFPTDYYIPTSAISNFDGDKVYLNVTKDDAMNQGWDQVPTESTTMDTGSYAATDTTMTGETYATDMDRVVDQDMTAGTMDTGVDRNMTRTSDSDNLRVELHEEELSATTREREIGNVRIEKDVITEQQTLEVPVTEERVHIERHAVNRDASGDANAFEEGTIEVPIRGEEVELRKSVRVGEEVELSKDAVQHTEQVGGTVRREEVRIDETDNRGTGKTRNQS